MHTSITTRCSRFVLALLGALGIAVGGAVPPTLAAQCWSSGTTGTATIPQASGREHVEAGGIIRVVVGCPLT